MESNNLSDSSILLVQLSSLNVWSYSESEEINIIELTLSTKQCIH